MATDPQRPATTLFAVDDEDGAGGEELRIPEVHYISVLRWDGGAKVTAPRLFPAEELPDQAALFALYGGGKYELLGRDASSTRIVAKRALNLSGPSKPLHPQEQAAAPSEAQQGGGAEVAQLLRAMLAAQQPAAAAAGGFNWQTIVALAGALAPVFGQYLQASAQRDAESQRRHHEFMTALLTQQQSAGDKLITAMGQIYSSSGGGGGGGGGGKNDFIKGLEYATEFMAGKAEAMAEQGEDFGIKDVIPMLTALIQQQQAPGTVPAVGSGTPTNGAAS